MLAAGGLELPSKNKLVCVCVCVCVCVSFKDLKSSGAGWLEAPPAKTGVPEGKVC